MPDLRDKQKAKARARRHDHKSPGDNSALPNNEALDGERLPGDVARDIGNDGVAFDPANQQHRSNP